MKRSKLRPVLPLVLLVIACGAGYYIIQVNREPDPSLQGRLQELNSPWASRRRAAAASLAGFTRDADRVGPALARALRDPDTEVRLNALRSLKTMGSLPGDTTPVLVDVFQHDGEATIRQEAASLLPLTKTQSAEAALVAAIDDPDVRVRLAAINALNLSEDLGHRGLAVDKMTRLVDPAQSEEIRMAAVQSLGGVIRTDEKVARLMVELLKQDSSPFVRNSAALLVRNTTFDFSLPALIAALDDESPQVRITAGAGVAAVGLQDDRTVPALCRAARRADEMTREGMGVNIGLLRFDAPTEGISTEQATKRFQTAVRELISVVDHKESAAREQALLVLTRVAASYQQSLNPLLLEPAKEALAAVVARVLDENEDTAIRLSAMNLWTIVHPGRTPLRGGRRSAGDSADSGDQLHARAAWLGALTKSLLSSDEAVRSRALVLLVDDLKTPQAPDWYREAWRKVVPEFEKATAVKDSRTSLGAVAILGLLGPEAAAADGTLKALVRDSPDSALRQEAEKALRYVAAREGLASRDASSRIMAAESIGGLAWRAGPVLPALCAAIKDPDVKVRKAVTSAMRSLGHDCQPAAATLSSALRTETDPSLRVAMLEALEAIEQGTSLVRDAHLNALRDPDPLVRSAAATFQKVPADDSLLAAIGKALADSNEQVRKAAAGSLAQILFESPTVIPMLLEAASNEAQRKDVLRAVDEHLETITERADFRRLRGDLPRLRVTVARAIPALRKALELKNDDVSSLVFNLLGRIVGFAHLGRDAELQKAMEPGLETYLLGLQSSNPDIVEEVLSGLETVPIHRAEIVAALVKYLERDGQSAENRQAALRDLAAQTSSAASEPRVREALVKAMPILLQALANPANEARMAGVETLAHLGSDAKPAEDTLTCLAKCDPQPDIRKAAENAVQAINGTARKPAAGHGD